MTFPSLALPCGLHDIASRELTPFGSGYLLGSLSMYFFFTASSNLYGHRTPTYCLMENQPTCHHESSITALKDVRVSSHQIPAHNWIPNTSVQRKPLLIYHSAFHPGTSASAIEAHLAAIGVVEPQWRYTMYSISHFHSTAHELLCVASGQAQLCFGHEDNPSRVLVRVGAGDVIVVPAGVAHRLLEDVNGDFGMVGSYPIGQNWDMCYGTEGEAEQVKSIAKLEWFARDPIYGDEGPVLETRIGG